MAHTTDAGIRVPRPAQWESPSLNDRAGFFMHAPTRLDTAPDSILQSLSRLGHDDINKIANFFRKLLGFKAAETWEPHHLLGQGGFGRAALWVKRDKNNEIEDEVVLKEMDEASIDTWMCYKEPPGNVFEPDLLMEAVLHKLVNQQDTSNIVHLRGYKYVTASTVPKRLADRNIIRNRLLLPPAKRQHQRTWYRLFFEYAPYGDLEDLLRRYRIWHQYLPEPFLWHVFDSLCHALLALYAEPARIPILGTNRRWPKGSQIIHFDIKPNNVFLGYEGPSDLDGALTGGAEHLAYPSIKLSDFGIGEMTNPNDSNNPSEMYGQGTSGHKPPEQLHYGVEFRHPPNGKYRPAIDTSGEALDLEAEEESDPDPGFKFMEKFNVWGVGKLMYDLATLSDSGEYRFRWAKSEAEYRRNGNDVLSDYQTDPFQFSTTNVNTQNPYSGELMDLISQCLRPSIDDRIELHDLYDQVQQRLRHFDTKDPKPDDNNDGNSLRANNTSQESKKLFFKNNDINSMAMGDALFVTRESECLRVLKDTAGDNPNWPELILPPNPYQTRIAHLKARWRRRRNRFNVVNGRIQFQPFIVRGPFGGAIQVDYSDSDADSNDDDSGLGPLLPNRPVTRSGPRAAGTPQQGQNGTNLSSLRRRADADAARLLQSIAEDLDGPASSGRNNAGAPQQMYVSPPGMPPPVQRPYNRRGPAGRGFVGINYGHGYGCGRGGRRRNGRLHARTLRR